MGDSVREILADGFRRSELGWIGHVARTVIVVLLVLALVVVAVEALLWLWENAVPRRMTDPN